MSNFDVTKYYTPSTYKQFKNREIPLDNRGHWSRLQEMVASPKGEIPVKLKRAPAAFMNVGSAKNWIQHHKKIMDKRRVAEEDINQDGLYEVVVHDRKTGKPIIINGWTLARDDYPYRKEYYGLEPKQREGTTYGK